ncbi:MAG: hypothetical protein ACOCXH_05020, partial [Cyclobacteriaceae bacterium]
MKKITFIIVSLIMIFIISSCEKEIFESENTIDIATPIIFKDITVENNYLCFSTVEVFDSVVSEIWNMDEEKYSTWIKQFENFQSAKELLDIAENELMNIKVQEEFISFKQKYKDNFSISEEGEIDYRFY